MESERGALLQEFVRVPWRQRLLVLIVTACVTVAALAWALAQPTVYTASSRILLQTLSPKARKALGVSGAASANLDMLTAETQAKLIGSSQIAGRVSTAIGGLISRDELTRAVEASVVADNLIEIRATSQNATFAQAEANAFAEAYLSYRAEQNAAAVAAVTKQISEQKALIESRLAIAERTIEQSAASLALLPPPELSDTAQQAIRTSLTSDQDRATAERVRLTAARRELNTQQADLTGATGSPGQLVTRAPLPRRPAGPGPVSIGLAGLLAGLMLGVAVAFVRDRLGERVGADDEAWAEDAPVLARLPNLGRRVVNASDLLVAASAEPGGKAETYRSLREALAARGLGESFRILLVTSPGRREGKSVTAANLAAALAGSGLHTIALSADLRRPRLGSFFGVDNRPGLTDVLKGTATLTSALRSCSVPNLMVLPTASEAATGSDLLATPAFARLLRALADEADVVVVDAAGVADGADAVILAGLCGASLLVVQDGVTLAGAAERAVQALARAGAAPLGAVVSPAPTTSTPVRVAVAGLGAATVFLGSVVWASTASVRETGAALAYNAPAAGSGGGPAETPDASVPVVPQGTVEMTPEIRALWEAATAQPSPTAESSPTQAKASPSPSKKASPSPTKKASPTPTNSGSTTGGQSAPTTSPSSSTSPSAPATTPAPPPPPGTPPVNHVPDADHDLVKTQEDTPVAISPLANDSGLEDGVLAVQVTRNPLHGSVVVNGDQFLYTPNTNYAGVDSFRYTVTDLDGETSSASVTVSVSAVSDATPVAADDDGGTIQPGERITIDVLANDQGLDDGVKIEITRGPSHGGAVVSDGKIVYTADGDKQGAESFEYTLIDTDGQRSSATVRITIKGPDPEPSPSPSPEPSPDPVPTEPAPDPTPLF